MISRLIKALTRPPSAPGTDPLISDRDVLANANATYAEIRAMVDHQVRIAASLDTKAGALVTAVVALAAIAGPHVHLDSTERQVAGFVTFTLALLVAIFVSAALWPRDFSYGANAEQLVASLESYSQVSVALARAEALRDAWRLNDAALDAKHDWYSRALTMLPLLLISIGAMVVLQAIRT